MNCLPSCKVSKSNLTRRSSGSSAISKSGKLSSCSECEHNDRSQPSEASIDSSRRQQQPSYVADSAAELTPITRCGALLPACQRRAKSLLQIAACVLPQPSIKSLNHRRFKMTSYFQRLPCDPACLSPLFRQVCNLGSLTSRTPRRVFCN